MCIREWHPRSFAPLLALDTWSFSTKNILPRTITLTLFFMSSLQFIPEGANW